MDSVRDAFASSQETNIKEEIKTPSQDEQISFFSQNMSPAVEKLKSLDIMETTPSEAIRILSELKELADKE